MDFPNRDDFIVVKVTQILDYGVFVEMLEYNKSRGFVHISNVSSSWVKNIRNFVKMNQVRVAKVLNVDVQKRQVDLSFAGVNPMRERQVLSQFKQINREEKLLQILSKIANKPYDVVYHEVADVLTQEHGSVSEAFEKIALGYEPKELPAEWIASVKELVEKNIVVSKKEVSGILKVSSLESSGLEAVKSVLSEADSIKGCDLSYAGGGNYNISCSGLTFKESDKILAGAVDSMEKKAKKLGVSLSFKRNEKK